MARPEKVAVVERVRDQFQSTGGALLTDYRGLTVAEMAELRAELRKVGASAHVAKNKLVRRAAVDAGFEGLDELLTGPTALVFWDEDPIAPAKALKKFAATHDKLVIKGGYLDGEVLDAQGAIGLASLASREEVLSSIAGLANSAIAMPAVLANAALSQVPRLVAALQEKQAA